MLKLTPGTNIGRPALIGNSGLSCLPIAIPS